MKKLWQEFEIKGKIINNRIVYPPIASEKYSAQQEEFPQLFENYQRLSSSGVGTLIVEHSYINPTGKFSPRQISIASDDTIDFHRQLAKLIKDQGVFSALQINHAGAHCLASVNPNPAKGPSAIRLNPGEIKVEALSLKEIQTTVEYFAAAALRACKAGYDMVEIHSAHGFLISQFLSPLTNHRTDAYGGDLKNRMRFLLEVVEAVKSALPSEIILAVRLGVSDHPPGLKLNESTYTLTEGIQVAKALEENGIDLLDISGGMCGSRPGNISGEGYFVPFAQAIKQQGISLPLVITGGVRSLKIAEAVIEQNDADFVGIGRALWENPEWLREEKKHA
ncbi:MAG TPA: NADH:flavin oxidoreductase [Caldisericia bacterium]|nr:NADH:flavin oxidoreductase [Caldisericia bacterium]